jgi:hypothetical protein
MVTHIAVCGDSFGVGMGLPDKTCFEDNFSGVVANKFNLPQRVYARSGCCNFTIYLQVKKVIEQVERDNAYNPLVVITTTFHERFVFPLDDGFKYVNPDLSQIEYKAYPPYNGGTTPCRELAFNINKDSRLITETISNIQHFQCGTAPGIADLFVKVNKDKFNAIAQYYTELFDTGVKKEYDESLFVTINALLTYHNIPHVIMGFHLPQVIPEKNRMENHWGYYTQKYPDNRGSGHCDATGNRLVGEALLDHIEKFNIL